MSKKSNFGAAVALGALIGGAVAFFLSPRSGKENREMAKEKLDEIKKNVEGKKMDQIVKEIFGTVSEEGKKVYIMARNEINDQLENVQKSISEIDRDKYKTIVTDVMTRVQKEGDMTKDRMAKLQEYLLHKWDMAQEEAKADAKKLAKDVIEKDVKKKSS